MLRQSSTAGPANRRTVARMRRWIGGSVSGRDDALRVEWGSRQTPGDLVANAGEPVRIRFRRFGSQRAHESVCFPELGVFTTLAAAKESLIDLGRRRPGRYRLCTPDGNLEAWLTVLP